MNGQENEIMDLNEIIEMARQAGINYRELSDEFATGNGDGVEIEQMQAFAKLVAAKEREACAQIGDSFHDDAANCGDLIRARGEA